MKKITYALKLESSLIVSPRSGRALYREMDEFCTTPEVEPVENNQEREIKVVYPFYQYGEYRKYDPEHTDYYLPGSSVKGALKGENTAGIQFMADDVMVPTDGIVLRNLWKAQYLKEEEKAEFAVFFNNVGIEMIKDGTNLYGELYLDENIEFAELLRTANKATKDKIVQMCAYLQMLLTKNYKEEALKNYLLEIKRNLSAYQNKNDVILLGGYKGLLHSMLLDCKKRELTGGLFIDYKTKLPHGLVKMWECCLTAE
nr:hypothetical protein [uncultured Eisenbergiella sp.]